MLQAPYSTPTSKKWKALSILLIFIIVVETGFIAYNYLDFNSKSSNIQTQFSSLQTEFSNLQQQFEDNQGYVQQLQQLIKSLVSANQSYSLTISNVFDVVKDSVVLIKTKVMTRIGLQDYAEGSGFVYDTSGLIITNNHVIEGADEISVTLMSGNIRKAIVIGTDPYSDIAVIKIDNSSETLYPVVLGDSFTLIVGEQVVAIGNPYGLSDTITAGIVSQVGRELSTSGGYEIVDVIQTDAAINPGNSGGPLVNMMGEVIGMNTAIVSGSTGVGFAIPSDTIKRELQSLITSGKYEHPWLGIQGTDVDPDIASAIGLNYTYGVLITAVVSGGPADIAGLKGGTTTMNIGGTSVRVGGDVIVALDGLKISSLNDLLIYLERNKHSGDTVTLTIIRSSQKLTKQVVLGVRS
jgi:S1-C subfamily serine protease